MKVLFDTSAIVPLLVKNHPNHSSANKTYNSLRGQNSTLFIASHSIAEIYRTLTWGHSYLQFSANQARKSIHQTVIPHFSIAEVSSSNYLDVVDWMAKSGLTGAIIYDALIAKAASLIEATYLVTYNAKDFQRVFPENGADLIIPG